MMPNLQDVPEDVRSAPILGEAMELAMYDAAFEMYCGIELASAGLNFRFQSDVRITPEQLRQYVAKLENIVWSWKVRTLH
jgi:hypothetical protein